MCQTNITLQFSFQVFNRLRFFCFLCSCFTLSVYFIIRKHRRFFRLNFFANLSCTCLQFFLQFIQIGCGTPPEIGCHPLQVIFCHSANQFILHPNQLIFMIHNHLPLILFFLFSLYNSPGESPNKNIEFHLQTAQNMLHC